MGKRRRSVSGRSALSIESLEPRQLLATIVAGSGTEVGSNITVPNGNTFDQILLTGASVSVKADPGQIVRISFLDLSGDIAQTEFSGGGTVTVSLEELRTVGMAGYVNNNPDQFLDGKKIDYVQGLASIHFEKPEVTSNIGIFSAGAITNPGFFAGQAKQGGNNVADIARLVIVGDPTNAAGYSNFGGVRAGNVVFGASSGIVGIRAENVAVQQIVAIGDVEASGSGVPTLLFHANSQFQTVFVRGGDLLQPNGAVLDGLAAGDARTLGGFSYFNSTEGSNSGGKLLPSQPIDESSIRGVGTGPFLVSGAWFVDWRNIQAVEVLRSGENVSSLYGGDWLAKGGIQVSLDYLFAGKSFQESIFILGDLAAGLTINLAGAKAITVAGDFSGGLVANRVGAAIETLTINGRLDGTVMVHGLDRSGVTPVEDGRTNSIGALVVNGTVGPQADIRAEQIGSVSVMRDFSGTISTNVNAPNRSALDNAWNGVAGVGTQFDYVDYEGAIGDVSIGYDLSNNPTGGSIINGTIQGMGGIGNVRVSGDVAGFSPGSGVFVTSSNPAAAVGVARSFGEANIGRIDVFGDVSLTLPTQRLIHIAGNGNYGDVSVIGFALSGMVPGTKFGSSMQYVTSSDTLMRILSPFTDAEFKADATKGQRAVPNFDPDGPQRPLGASYSVTAADVAAGAQVYAINPDNTLGGLVAAKIGDRVPVVVGGIVDRDGAGNVVYVNNVGLFQQHTKIVDSYGPDVEGLVSGNRGSVFGIFNHFGRIEIDGFVSGGPAAVTTGRVVWTDAPDQKFGGVILRENGATGAGAASVTIGQIAIMNTSGAKADLVFTGLIGAPVGGGGASGTPVKLAGLTVDGFEDVYCFQLSSVAAQNIFIHTAEITNGVSIKNVTGSGEGPSGVATSVNFDAGFLLGTGVVAAGDKTLLSFDAGAVNSTINLTGGFSVAVEGGGANAAIGAITLKADAVNFAGALTAPSLGALTINAGKGISTGAHAGVSFTTKITADTWAGLNASATTGDVIFTPGLAPYSAGRTKTAVGAIAISTQLTAAGGGGDIFFGGTAGMTYNADFGDITLAAGHEFKLVSGTTITEFIGDVAINLTTAKAGNIGNLTVTTTAGKISDALTIEGNVGDISYTTGATALEGSDKYLGSPGNVGRAGGITANQTIWGSRGATSFTTAGHDGTPLTYAVHGENYRVLPAGGVFGTLNYAGASTVAGDAFAVRGGSGGVLINYNIVGQDDNQDGVIAASEIGHGGNVSVRTVSGDIQMNFGTQLADSPTLVTLGHVNLQSLYYAQVSGVITGTDKGDIELSFKDLPGGPASGGFEGQVGNIMVETQPGNILFAQSRFDGKVGSVFLSAGSVVHSGGTMIGNIGSTGSGVTFMAAHGQISTMVDPGGVNNPKFNSTVTGVGSGDLAENFEDGDAWLAVVLEERAIAVNSDDEMDVRVL